MTHELERGHSRGGNAMNAKASFVAAIASGIGVLISFYFSFLARRAAKSQQRLAGLGVTAEWLREVRSWAAEAIDLLSEAEYCIPSSQKSGPADLIGICRHRLSAIIDRGRLFFPNQPYEEIGIEKPSAYRGLRHSALDPLAAAVRVLDGVSGRLWGAQHSHRALADRLTRGGDPQV
jgi:hypothetical protein